MGHGCRVSDATLFPFMFADGLKMTSAFVPSSEVCPQCGTNKKTGKRTCCARGGSWFNNCGDVGDSTFKHTWGEGVRACQSLELVQAVLSREEATLLPRSNISILEQRYTREGTDTYGPGGESDTVHTDSTDCTSAMTILTLSSVFSLFLLPIHYSRDDVDA